MDQAHQSHQHQRPSQLSPTGEVRIAMGDGKEDGKTGNDKTAEKEEEEKEAGSPTKAAAGDASKKKDLRDSNDQAKRTEPTSGGLKTPPSATGDGKQNLLSVQP